MTFVDHEESGNRYHSTRINLRWADFDQFQHVNNAAYLEFSQDARTDFVRGRHRIDMAVPALSSAGLVILKALSSSEVAVVVDSFM